MLQWQQKQQQKQQQQQLPWKKWQQKQITKIVEVEKEENNNISNSSGMQHADGHGRQSLYSFAIPKGLVWFNLIVLVEAAYVGGTKVLQRP